MGDTEADGGRRGWVLGSWCSPSEAKDGTEAVDAGVITGLAVGAVLLVAGANALVWGASRVAAAVGVSPIVVGLTIVAFGTSAPELAVSVGAALTGSGGVALGNAVGSNVLNVLLILGVSAWFGDLVVHQRVVRLDVPLLIVVTLGTWALAADGQLGPLDGGLGVAGIVLYTAWLYRASRAEPAEVIDEYAEEFGADRCDARHGWPLALLAIAAGVGGLVAGAQLLVGAAMALAAALGVSQLVIGLTVVAAGTSLPELATSVVAAIRGERDIAVGNVVGSNLFNLLAVLGVSAVVAPLEVPRAALYVDFPVAFLVTLVALPALATGLLIERWEGALLVACYTGYVTVVVLTGTASPMAEVARWSLFGALTATAVVLLAAARVRRSVQPAPAD